MNRLQRFVLLLSLMVPMGLFAQDDLIYEEFRNLPLPQALQRLEQGYGLLFAYDPQQLAAFRVDVRLEGETLPQTLDHLLTGTGFTYRIQPGGEILLMPRPESRVGRPHGLSGWVQDAETGTPLPFASLRKGSANRGVYTDEAGKFAWEQLLQVGDTLLVTYLGYESQRRVLQASDFGRPLRILLTPAVHALPGVLISEGSNHTVTIADAASRIRLNPERLGSLAPLGEPDILRTLQLLPGVSSGGESAGGVRIRGGSHDQTLLLFDGITVYQPGHFFGLYSTFNHRAVKDVRLYRGGFDARYGGRTAGVVDIAGRAASAQAVHGGAGLNLMHAQAHLELPLFSKKGSLLLAARRAFSDLIESPLYRRLFDNRFQQGVIYRDQREEPTGLAQLDFQPVFYFSDLNAKLTWQPTNKDLLSLSYLQAQDWLDYQATLSDTSGVQLQTTDRLRLSNRGLSLFWSRQWQADWYSKANLAYSFARSDYGLAEELEVGQLQSETRQERLNDLHDLTFRLDQTWQPGTQHDVAFGLQLSAYWVLQDEFFANDAGALQEEKNTSEAILAAAYVQHTWEMTPRWQSSLGIRGSYYDRTAQPYLEPRVSLAFQATADWSFKLAAGRYHQFLHQVNVQNPLQVGQDFWALAEPDSLPVSQAHHLILGGAYAKDGWLFDLELYAKSLRQLNTYSLFYEANFAEIRPGELLRNGRGQVHGLDLMVQREVGPLTTWLAYTLARVQQRFADISEGAVFPGDFDQRHQLKLVGILDLPHWEISATWLLASGRPFTSAEDVVAISPIGQDPAYWLVFGQRNGERLPAYHRLDVSASYQLDMGEVVKGQIGFSVLNLYNRRNVMDKRYRIQPSGQEGVRPLILSMNRNMLGINPNLFINFSF